METALIIFTYIAVFMLGWSMGQRGRRPADNFEVLRKEGISTDCIVFGCQRKTTIPIVEKPDE